MLEERGRKEESIYRKGTNEDWKTWSTGKKKIIIMDRTRGRGEIEKVREGRRMENKKSRGK